VFLTRPISLALLVIAALLVPVPVVLRRRVRKAESGATDAATAADRPV
jgi:TctA family transporter